MYVLRKSGRKEYAACSIFHKSDSRFFNNFERFCHSDMNDDQQDETDTWSQSSARLNRNN